MNQTLHDDINEQLSYAYQDTPPLLPSGWTMVGLGQLISFAVGAAIFFLLVLTAPQNFVLIVDHVNLAIHEAGHVVLLPFGQMVHMWGGTLFQCLVPIAFGVYFWAHRQTAGTAVAGLWLGENLPNIAHYMADAQAMALPLIGGGTHDWNYILTRLGLLNHCGPISTAVHVAGWIIMLAAVAWYVWRWRVSAAYLAQWRKQRNA